MGLLVGRVDVIYPYIIPEAEPYTFVRVQGFPIIRGLCLGPDIRRIKV